MIEDKFASIMHTVSRRMDDTHRTSIARDNNLADPGVRVICNTIEMVMPMHRKPNDRCVAGGQHSARGMQGDLEYPDL